VTLAFTVPGPAAPDQTLLGGPLRSGEGFVVGDVDFALTDKRKQLVDAVLRALSKARTIPPT
jgi:hypothetical protein